MSYLDLRPGGVKAPGTAGETESHQAELGSVATQAHEGQTHPVPHCYGQMRSRNSSAERPLGTSAGGEPGAQTLDSPLRRPPTA